MKILAEDLKLNEEQTKRLKSLGEVVFLSGGAKPKEKYLKKFEGVDIVCTECFHTEEIIYGLRDKFISLPFVGVGWLDLRKLAKNNVKIANAPGCNKAAVSEWVIAMMLNLSRSLLNYIDTKEVKEIMPPIKGLAGNKVVILGHGSIGKRVGRICEVMEADVDYFKRGDNLMKKVQDADFVVNTLAHNLDTEGMLNKQFFSSLKKGMHFISITDTELYDVSALFNALDSGKLAGAAIDPAGVSIFDAKSDFYLKLANNPKILTTPHIAFHSNHTVEVAYNIMIDNVEAWIKKKPQNIVN